MIIHCETYKTGINSDHIIYIANPDAIYNIQKVVNEALSCVVACNESKKVEQEQP